MPGVAIEKKVVSISPKRQITIPQKFFKKIGFDKEAECIIRGNELIIRPAKVMSNGEFSELILEELIEQGLSGKELLNAFKKEQAKVRPAVENMLLNANAAARGEAEYETVGDIFGEA